jgi:hypothetical protein
METPWYLNWYLPNAVIIEYTLKEVLRWAADNMMPIAIITNLLTYLKIWAIKNNRVKDDKILTWLIGFFTFQWVGKITAPIPPDIPAGAKGNPIALTDVVEQKEWKEKNTEAPKL